MFDAELGASISESEREAPATGAVAPVVELVTGPRRPMAPADSAVLGTLIVEGLLVLRTESGMRSHVEVLGEAI